MNLKAPKSVKGTVEIIGKAEVLANIDALHMRGYRYVGHGRHDRQINANLVMPDGVTAY